MNQDLWDKWKSQWEWISSVAIKRKWKIQPLVINEKLNASKFEQLEFNTNESYPIDFKNIIMNYSSGVSVSWVIINENIPTEFKDVFGGCGACRDGKKYNCLWDFENLLEFNKTYHSWLLNCFINEEEDYNKIWHNKIPFIEVPNGDFIAFDKLNKNQVVYLSHDDGPLHGYKLADNFIEFITLWSRLGLVGTESEQFVPFYDFEKEKLQEQSIVIDRWHEWLDKKVEFSNTV